MFVHLMIFTLLSFFLSCITLPILLFCLSRQ
nr:MAG TPA: hypothetical protein [Caudoviricetes sp.]